MILIAVGEAFKQIEGRRRASCWPVIRKSIGPA